MATNPPTAGFSPIWANIIPALTAISLAFTPLAVGWMAFQSNSSITSKDYVALAVSILNAKDSPPASRKWAAQLLAKLSPVDVPTELQNGLGAGDELGGRVTEIRTVEVKIPIAIPCLNKEIMDQLRKARPVPLSSRPMPKGIVDRQREILIQLVKLDGYAKLAEIALDGCSKLAPIDIPGAQAKAK